MADIDDDYEHAAPKSITKPEINHSVGCANWSRYEYVRERGHNKWCNHARRCDDFYLGGGRQWTAEAKAALGERPPVEINMIRPNVDTALGYQIHNRMEMSFAPRAGEVDDNHAMILNKLARHICDREHYHWIESQMFADGVIQQRGYIDMRMRFDKNMQGDIDIALLDPMNVMPDPDANSYDPDDWGDVIITRWLTADLLEDHYGTAARRFVVDHASHEDNFGADEEGEDRTTFAGETADFCSADFAGGVKHWRIIDRQHWRYDVTDVLITHEGDIRPTAGMTPEAIAFAVERGGMRTKQRMRRVRWTVTCGPVVILDDWSPFKHFTPIPYFAYFRRGKTSGLVDNAIGPQEVLNKSVSQYIHVINTTANSGWTVEENALVNMSEEELEDRGSETGLVIVHKKGQKPEKIQPNQVPNGIDKMVSIATQAMNAVGGVDEVLRGTAGPEVSGYAIEQRQFAAQQKLTVPLENLAHTRRLVAVRMLDMIQSFYTEPRIIRVTETDPAGKPVTSEVAINQDDGNGGLLYDMTIGEYDVSITERPVASTFRTSQMMQLYELKKEGAPIPWPLIVRLMNVDHKEELMEAMENDSAPPPDPLNEARAKLALAQAHKAEIEGVNKAVQSQYSAVQTAGLLAANAQLSGSADALLLSAGFQDQDASPIVPATLAQPMTDVVMPPANTNPTTPASAATGINAGIETATIGDA